MTRETTPTTSSWVRSDPSMAMYIVAGWYEWWCSGCGALTTAKVQPPPCSECLPGVGGQPLTRSELIALRALLSRSRP